MYDILLKTQWKLIDANMSKALKDCWFFCVIFSLSRNNVRLRWGTATIAGKKSSEQCFIHVFSDWRVQKPRAVLNFAVGMDTDEAGSVLCGWLLSKYINTENTLMSTLYFLTACLRFFFSPSLTIPLPVCLSPPIPSVPTRLCLHLLPISSDRHTNHFYFEQTSISSFKFK